MNALALGDFLTREGVANQVYTATGIPGIAPAYERDQALGAMAQGKVLIFEWRHWQSAVHDGYRGWSARDRIAHRCGVEGDQRGWGVFCGSEKGPVG